jgi:hypothetical protein
MHNMDSPNVLATSPSVIIEPFHNNLRIVLYKEQQHEI